MLNTIQVRNSAGALLELPLEDPADGFQVHDVAGLDPVDATIVSSSFAQLDGTQYHSSKRQARNIVLTIGLDISEGPAAFLRDRLYKFLMPKRYVNFRLTNIDGTYYDISGRVETFKCPLFVKDVVATISIICFDPDFVDPEPETLVGTTVSTETDTILEYDGTVETGMLLTLNVDRALADFTVYQLAPDNMFYQLDFAESLLAGDVVTISTVPGNKYARLTRGGTTSSVLYAVSPYSKWLEIEPGTNKLRVYAEGAAIPYAIEYYRRLGGL